MKRAIWLVVPFAAACSTQAPISTSNTDASSPSEAGVPLSPVEWHTCDLSDWPSREGYTLPPPGIECATVDVSLGYEAATLALHVGRWKSKTNTGKAIFSIEGGPGNSSFLISGLVAAAIPNLNETRDVLFVDQRGTGLSGYLACPSTTNTGAAKWKNCATANEATNFDHYLTSSLIADFETIRIRLGYEKVDLLGFSYGTRVALEYIRVHPERVDVAILDGVAPPDADLFSDTVTSFDRGVAMLIADCTADPKCVAVSPSLSADLDARRSTLRAKPRVFKVNGATQTETEATFVSFLKPLLSTSDFRYRVPRAVHDAVMGNHARWNALLSELLGAQVADGLATWSPSSSAINVATLCAEALPNTGGIEKLKELYNLQKWQNRSIVDKAESCPDWNVRSIDANARKAVSAPHKVLLLSGAIDLNVDPKWATHAQSTLPNAVSLNVPYSTHLATYVPCVGTIVAAFLNADGDMSKVDSSCFKTLTAPSWE